MLDRVKNGDRLLDLGCAFGQELRQLVSTSSEEDGTMIIYDSAPSQNLYGVDLRPEFLELGLDLFLDRATIKSHFIDADILDDKSRLVTQLAGELNIVYISLFLHVFDFETQVTVAKRVLDLLAPKAGSLIVCRVVACRDQAVGNATNGRLPYYYHDLASWNRLWERVQQETGLKLKVDSWEQNDALAKKHPLEGIYMLGSSIRRE
ncbi:uncharacterized protein N7515_002121 [Penicillium bovifimosum]|uniref:Methyltransferase domain-containing protein n=1 Tax=Penicillium bovifimosum TaxID=126998 RepID=A0A9W9HB12_9EURO|nr:uncharacterized protein N7515_002121 [Penicillium bovifimosum]KAJ5143334.1 hypothetical protein N7515_002121 [Penicillium bovifimosum]